MTNEVYGFAEFEQDSDYQTLEQIQALTSLGIVEIPVSNLFGFPKNIDANAASIVFKVTDSPSSELASYLVDFVDYAPEANIRLPATALDRAKLLIDFVESLFDELSVSKLVLAITVCSQIEEVKSIKCSEFSGVFLADMEELAPPSNLYLILAE